MTARGATPEPDLLAAAERINRQLDRRVNATIAALPPIVRLAVQGLKVTEEVGELADAINGTLGENPRKGMTHTVDDVIAEAIDVTLSALVLVEMAAPGRSRRIIADRLLYLAERARQSGAPDVGAEPARTQAK